MSYAIKWEKKKKTAVYCDDCNGTPFAGESRTRNGVDKLNEKHRGTRSRRTHVHTRTRTRTHTQIRISGVVGSGWGAVWWTGGARTRTTRQVGKPILLYYVYCVYVYEGRAGTFARAAPPRLATARATSVTQRRRV